MAHTAPLFDPGLATLVVAFVPVIVAAGGFWLRERYLQRQLAASLLQEIRLKLDNLMSSVDWAKRAKEMIETGVEPRIILEGKPDFIFDQAGSRLLGLPTSVLRRVIKFYHLDDFHNIAMSEFRDKDFQTIAKKRKLAHLYNTTSGLLLPAIKEGVYAELALRVVSEMSLLEQRSFMLRGSSRITIHRGRMIGARTAAADRLRKLQKLKELHRRIWDDAGRDTVQ